ncbi:MAG TPA: hypothetical protein VH165_34065, partial [Kofleriaceae bacterium]|nr:hypothetical protein [Kofleriaceae bacterium]
TAIVTGENHSCALLDDHSVKCWGDNGAGQLGNGNQGGSSTAPVTVQVITGVTALAAGNGTTCAVDGAGAAQCWGANSRGQLGRGPNTQNSDETFDPQPTPAPMILPAGGAVSVAVGDAFSCAVTAAGAVFCTGDAQAGELGPANLGQDNRSPTPLQIPLSAKAVSVLAGDQFACAIDDQHGLWCWGANDNFELADGTSENRVFPVRASYPDAMVASAGGGFLCVQSSDGLRCGGYDGLGQLGNGIRTTQVIPEPIAKLTNVSALSSGDSYTCALVTASDMTHGATCWGENDFGEVGDGTFTGRPLPTNVSELGPVQKIVTGGGHACALRTDGTVWCWGANDHGQLGDATFETRGSARPVAASADMNGLAIGTLSGVIDIAAGRGHACAILTGGAIKCWGQNNDGQLGSGDTNDQGAPVDVKEIVDGLTGAVSIVAGDLHSCATDGKGKVWCWGAGFAGQLGHPAGMGMPPQSSAVPVAVVGLGGATDTVDQLSAFGDFSCAHVATANTVWCWGAGDDGELGNNTYTSNVKPQQVPGSFLQVAAGGIHACAITTDGMVECWGGSYLGQAGVGYDSYNTPTPLPGLSGVTAITAGSAHTCALAGGAVLCWGDDRNGELGDGVSYNQDPVAPLLPCP